MTMAFFALPCVLAPMALVPSFCFLLLIHLSDSARKVNQKQKAKREVYQAAKPHELIREEDGGNGKQTHFLNLCLIILEQKSPVESLFAT